MNCIKTVLISVVVAGLLSGCPYTRYEALSGPTAASPNYARFDDDKIAEPNACTRFTACDRENVFPTKPFNGAPVGSYCYAAQAVSIGKSQRPGHDLIGVTAQVWVALLVPAAGGTPSAARIVGSTDPRFDSMAEEMAKTMVFQPKTCDGVAYDTYVVAPLEFGLPQ